MLQTAPANDYEAILSASGERVMLEANGSALAAGASPSNYRHVYLIDENATRLVTEAVAGGVDGGLFMASLDARGVRLLLNSSASNLVPGLLDTNGVADGFVANAPGDGIHTDGFED